MRVLVTGTREESYPRVFVAVDLARLAYHCWDRGEKLTLVHGDYPHGVDSYVRAYVERLPMQVERGTLAHEPYPADWSLGRRAGPLRNAHMVSLGADLCLAYPWGESRGTRGCARLSEDAGIPTLVSEHDLRISQTLEHRLRQAGIMLLERAG